MPSYNEFRKRLSQLRRTSKDRLKAEVSRLYRIYDIEDHTSRDILISDILEAEFGRKKMTEYMQMFVGNISDDI